MHCSLLIWSKNYSASMMMFVDIYLKKKSRISLFLGYVSLTITIVALIESLSCWFLQEFQSSLVLHALRRRDFVIITLGLEKLCS